MRYDTMRLQEAEAPLNIIPLESVILGSMGPLLVNVTCSFRDFVFEAPTEVCLQTISTC